MYTRFQLNHFLSRQVEARVNQGFLFQSVSTIPKYPTVNDNSILPTKMCLITYYTAYADLEWTRMAYNACHGPR